MIEGSGSARAVVLPIDQGKRWWSTRLFLLASLLRSLTAVRQVVFCDDERRFLGMASPAAIVDGLAAEFRVLGEFARALDETPSPSSDIESETARQTNAWTDFVSSPPPPLKPKPPPAAGPRKPRAAASAIGDTERAWKVGVRASLLARWLGERWVDRCIRVEGNELSMSQVQQIVDSLLPDVPVERRKNDPADGPIKPAEAGMNVPAGGPIKPKVPGFDLLVVDRDAFALELAREWVRTGLPRSPIR
jgi:hypothetical protein